jgi:hypothetical protein
MLKSKFWIMIFILNKSHPDLLVNFLDYWEIRVTFGGPFDETAVDLSGG